MELAKQMHEAEVYGDLQKKIKKQLKKQKKDLNDNEDLEMMDIIKKHSDHLRNMYAGIDDTHTGLLSKETQVMHKKIDDLELQNNIRILESRKAFQTKFKRAARKWVTQKIKDLQK